MRLVLLLTLFAALAPAAQAQNVRTERVQFARGATSATVRGSVLRDERVQYVLGARAGQRVEASVRSTEGNAILVVHGSPGDYGDWHGPAGVAVTEWTGRLADGGDVVVEVGPTRGNATYIVTFRIR